jgi:zinc protease
MSREKQQLESIKQNPQYLFMDSAYNTLYQGNKRAHLVESPSIYDGIILNNAVGFYSQRFGNANGMYYTFVGSFTPDQIKPLIELYLGGLPSGELQNKYGDLGMRTVKGKVDFTLHKGTEPQAMLGHFITGDIAYNPDDNFLLSQLNAVINNKIIDTIREKMSAIYGGGCGGAITRYPREEFTVQSQFPCSPDNIGKVDSAYFMLIESTKKDAGITEEDWKRVREPALERYKVSIKTNDYWLAGLQNAFLNQTDPDRLVTYEQRVKSVTPEKLVNTARKFYTLQNVMKAQWLPEEKK